MVVEPDKLRVRVQDKCAGRDDQWNPCPGNLKFIGLLCETVNYYIVQAQCTVCGRMYEFKRKLDVRKDSELREPTPE